MIVFGLDPGTNESAIVAFDGTRVLHSAQMFNGNLLTWLDAALSVDGPFGTDESVLAVEWIESFGMAVGREVFETCYWVGRFCERAQRFDRVTRRQVKLHLCGTMKAKDPNIRQVLLDRFGGSAAKGTKAHPGPLRDISAHRWSALAVAVTWLDLKDTPRTPSPLVHTEEF